MMYSIRQLKSDHVLAVDEQNPTSPQANTPAQRKSTYSTPQTKPFQIIDQQIKLPIQQIKLLKY
jgi:hypothetical protein